MSQYEDDADLPTEEFEIAVVKLNLATFERMEELEKDLRELRGLVDRVRRLTASDPDNKWCRQATIMLNYAVTGNANGKEGQ